MGITVRLRTVRIGIISLSVALGAGACGGDDDDAARLAPSTPTSAASPSVPSTTESPPVPPTPPETDRTTDPGNATATTGEHGGSETAAGTQRCLVRLHGKGGAGGPTETAADGTWLVFPDGNAEGWGARQWLYFPDADYVAAAAIVRDAIDGCDDIIINGFSNGAAFAAKLACRGETFDGRLLRVVIDDPVPDHGVDGCSPDPSVDLVLYWTGGLADTATPGWDCREGDWTCEGGETIGIDAVAESLGVTISDSPMDGHNWYWDAPELSDW